MRPNEYIKRLRAKFLRKRSSFFSSALRKLAGPSTGVPSTNTPVVLMGSPLSFVRQAPTALKLSREKPIGSIILWHDAQAGLARCASRRSRTEGNFSPAIVSLVVPASFNGGTLAGGFGGGVPSKVSMTHLPRTTGEVLVASDVNVRILACPSKPRRFSSAI